MGVFFMGSDGRLWRHSKQRGCARKTLPK